MADKKLIFLLVSALCAVQFTTVTNGATIDSKANLIDLIVTAVEGAVAEWVSDIEQQVTGEVARLQALIAAEVAKAQQMVLDATADLRAMIKQIQDAIKEAQDQADAVGGTDISACITGQEEKAIALVENAVLGVESCYTDKVNEAVLIVEDIVKQGENAILLGPETLVGINKCLHKTDLKFVVLCVYAEVNHFKSQSKKIRAEIEADIVHAEQLIATLSADIAECTSTQVTDTQLAINQLQRDIMFCVAGMLIPGGK